MQTLWGTPERWLHRIIGKPKLPGGSMQVKDIMSDRIDRITPGQALTQAALQMRDDDVGSLPVGAERNV